MTSEEIQTKVDTAYAEIMIRSLLVTGLRPGDTSLAPCRDDSVADMLRRVADTCTSRGRKDIGDALRLLAVAKKRDELQAATDALVAAWGARGVGR
jgi:hypothetical protein